MRVRLFEIEKKVEDLEFSSLNLQSLKMSADKFCNCCITKNNNEKDVMHVFEARSHLENCINILKSIIEPSDNILIENINAERDSYDIIEKYLENFFAIIDADSEKLKQDIKMARERFIIDYMAKIGIKSFMEKLKNSMDNLVLLSLENALKNFAEYKIKYRDKEFTFNGQVIADRLVFEYILFREFFISAKIKGSSARQKVTISSGAGGVSIHETNITKSRKKPTIQSEEPIESPPNIEDFSELFGSEEETNV